MRQISLMWRKKLYLDGLVVEYNTVAIDKFFARMNKLILLVIRGGMSPKLRLSNILICTLVNLVINLMS